MGFGQEIRCQVISMISLFDGGRHLLVVTSSRLGARAERRSRVAAGHRAATQPLTAASPAPGLRSRRGDVAGGMRTTSEASPLWTRYIASQTCIRLVDRDQYHDACMRIGGRSSGAAGPFWVAAQRPCIPSDHRHLGCRRQTAGLPNRQWCWVCGSCMVRCRPDAT